MASVHADRPVPNQLRSIHHPHEGEVWAGGGSAEAPELTSHSRMDYERNGPSVPLQVPRLPEMGWGGATPNKAGGHLDTMVVHTNLYLLTCKRLYLPSWPRAYPYLPPGPHPPVSLQHGG